MHSQSISL